MGREGVEFVGGIGLERSNWSLVGPLQPVVIKNNTTWMDSGESTMFFSLPSVMSSSLVIDFLVVQPVPTSLPLLSPSSWSPPPPSWLKVNVDGAVHGSNKTGTDDDFPPSRQHRVPRGGRVTGNGRSGGGSVPYPRMYGETDMEAQIHQLEREAYSSVLRAFKAQADAITWEKEGLLTNLRKELRLSNEEHKELLGRVNAADDVIERIRDWRQAGGVQSGMLSTVQAVHDPIPSPTVSVSRKKQKMTQSVHTQSFAGPTPPFHPQAVTTSHQPSSSTVKRGSVPAPASGAKGKKHKPGQILPGASSMKQYPSSGPTGRGQVSHRVSIGDVVNEPAEGKTNDSLIGRKVRTRWPDDNTFYEAIIKDYNQAEGRHHLVYDINSANETWEWVNLSEISPEDIQWVGEDPGISHRGGYSGSGHGMNRSVGRDNVLVPGRGRGTPKGQTRKDFPPSQNGIGKKAPDNIQLLHTDTLIKEVERVFGENHPDSIEIEKAKKVLKDHEQALIDAIAKLADISDGESANTLVARATNGIEKDRWLVLKSEAVSSQKRMKDWNNKKEMRVRK
ncbi:hypothetical protein C1H46_006103 [Malus baccata]|uniref:ENT domain-containing protein n=1 Tax=Malus baccata TaxID=106549 RepID=A0A540NBA8_MALBA|nr:hypothetical protein C1H46_006103 [Malus baccata]